MHPHIEKCGMSAVRVCVDGSTTEATAVHVPWLYVATDSVDGSPPSATFP
jgi:hypothetical protein